MVANPGAGFWAVHANEIGFSERLRDQGVIADFENLLFRLPDGWYTLFAGRPSIQNTKPKQKERGLQAPFV